MYSKEIRIISLMEFTGLGIPQINHFNAKQYEGDVQDEFRHTHRILNSDNVIFLNKKKINKIKISHLCVICNVNSFNLIFFLRICYY